MGLDKILALLESDDVDIRVHAVKVVANLAAEGYKLQILMLSWLLHLIIESS